MNYIGDIYRPPSEANSVILQITIGCSHNRCTFCEMYKKDRFRIKSYEEILDDILSLPDYIFQVKRIFLADGDALIMPTDELIQVLRLIKSRFFRLERIGIYASPRSVFSKTKEELKLLKQEGLGIVYLGVESGSGEVLLSVHKGVTKEKMIACARQIKESGLTLSVTLINGLGGLERTEQHAVESAEVMNAVNPDYIGLLSLMVAKGSPIYKETEQGLFTPMSPVELLLETRLFIESCRLKNSMIRSNHISNLVQIAGVLNEDKEKILSKINRILNDPYSPLSGQKTQFGSERLRM